MLNFNKFLKKNNRNLYRDSNQTSRKIVIIPILIIISSLPLMYISDLFYNVHNTNEVITYYNKSNYTQSLNTAINKWEETGLVTFKEVNNSKEADLVITNDQKFLTNFNKNLKKQGKNSDIRVIGQAISKRGQDLIILDEINKDENHPVHIRLVVHEIGHVLGLEHQDKKCSVMHTTVLLTDICDPEILYKADKTICGPTKIDINNLIKHKIKAENKINKKYNPYC